MPLDVASISVPAFPRLDEYVGLWAMEDGAFRSLFAAVSRMDMAAHVVRGAPPAASTLEYAGTDGRIAIVKALGTLMKQQSSIGQGTSTIQLRRDIRSAAADPNVNAIILAVESPGGTVAGTSDLADEVRAAAAQKPVWAFIDDLGASAAYWAASQADKVFANAPTAWVGSIGTLLTIYDMSGVAEKDGVKVLVFSTGSLKGAGAPGAPVTDEHKQYFQELVDGLQQSFDAGVMRGRRMTAEAHAANRTGAVFTATDALSRGLIDGIQSLEETIAQIEAVAKQRRGANMNAKTGVINVEPKAIEVPVTAPAAPLADSGITDLRAARAAEHSRIAVCERVCKPGGAALVAKAVAEGWDEARCELETLRAERPAAPSPGAAGRTTGAGEAAVIEAAMCMTAGMRTETIAASIPAAERERVMNLASSATMRGYGLHALMDQVIHNAGRHFSGSRKSDAFIREAFDAERSLRAELFSGTSLSGILSNLAGKQMNAAYTAVNVTWPQFCAVRSFNDFKVHSRYRLDASGAFKKIGPDGELTHMSLADATYTNRVDTYGVMATLSRQMIVNDDLGAFTQLPAIIGRLSALRVEEAAYVLLLSNPSSFFAAGNKNYASGAGSALSITSIAAAEKLFRNQVDSNGKPILVMPKIILCGTTLGPDAQNIFDEKVIIASGLSSTSSRVVEPAKNKMFNRYPPVISPYVDNTNIRDQDGIAITGQSSTAWWMFADPNDRAAMGVAFLNGQQVPTIESSMTEFETLGMKWRGYHDFGVGMEEVVGAVLSAGA